MRHLPALRTGPPTLMTGMPALIMLVLALMTWLPALLALVPALMTGRADALLFAKGQRQTTLVVVKRAWCLGVSSLLACRLLV